MMKTKLLNVFRNGHSSRHSSKGYIYTLEVLVAVSIILITIVLVFSTTPEEAETELAIMKQSAYDALYYLDKSDDLRRIVSTEGVKQLEKNLTDILPKNIKFDVIICQATCTAGSQVPSNRPVVVMDYYISGYQEMFINKKVRLWAWARF
jgi:hypothetical protein